MAGSKKRTSNRKQVTTDYLFERRSIIPNTKAANRIRRRFIKNISKLDFIAKLQIALKEANETGYWLELLYKTDYIGEQTYNTLDSACASIRVMLISSINTAKQNDNN